MQLFLNASADWKDEFFKGGFKDSLNYMFDSLNKLLTVTKPLARVLGSTLKGALNVLIAPIKLIGNLLEAVKDGFNGVAGDSLKFNDSIMTITGSVMLLVFAFRTLRNTALGAYAAAAAPYVAFALVMDDVHASFSDAKQGFLELIGKDLGGAVYGTVQEIKQHYADRYAEKLAQRGGVSQTQQSTNLMVTVNDSAFSNAIKVEVVGKNEENHRQVDEAFSN